MKRTVAAIIILFLLAACQPAPMPTQTSTLAPSQTRTPAPSRTATDTATSTPTPTLTPWIIYETVIKEVNVTLVVTATPESILQAECWETAYTQLDLNSCAAAEYELAKEKIEELISSIEYLSDIEKDELRELAVEWDEKAIKDCRILYGKIIEEGERLYYERGSMAPMLVNFCKMSYLMDFYDELEGAYFYP